MSYGVSNSGRGGGGERGKKKRGAGELQVQVQIRPSLIAVYGVDKVFILFFFKKFLFILMI